MKKAHKQKWRSAEHKRQSKNLEQDWIKLNEKYAPRKIDHKSGHTSRKKTDFEKANSIRRSSHANFPSVDTCVMGAVNTKKGNKYTGSAIIGIGTLHKSNAIPIFSHEEAKEISAMRR